MDSRVRGTIGTTRKAAKISNITITIRVIKKVIFSHQVVVAQEDGRTIITIRNLTRTNLLP